MSDEPKAPTTDELIIVELEMLHWIIKPLPCEEKMKILEGRIKALTEKNSQKQSNGI